MEAKRSAGTTAREAFHARIKERLAAKRSENKSESSKSKHSEWLAGMKERASAKKDQKLSWKERWKAKRDERREARKTGD